MYIFLFSVYIFILTSERVQTLLVAAPLHRDIKKKAFGRISKSAESLYFKPFSTLTWVGHCINLRSKISMCPFSQSSSIRQNSVRLAVPVPLMPLSAYTPANSHSGFFESVHCSNLSEQKENGSISLFPLKLVHKPRLFSLMKLPVCSALI